jgi:aerobic carbon-monoxide dehydrogenase medium subunit
MIPFELKEPASLGEAVALLDPDDPAVRPIAGGTALMLMMKSGLYQPRRLVSLRALGPGIAAIRETADGGLEIGAMVRLGALERAAEIRRAAPVIAETLVTHSNVRVRNVATIGGNLAHGDPHMDLPPVLIALGAVVTAAGPGGERRIAVEDLVTGYMETALGGDELITALHIPAQRSRRAGYIKVTARSADDWPALGVAVSAAVAGAAAREPRIAIGAATERAMRLPGAEAALAAGASPREVGQAAAAEAPVIADHHGSAAYKRVLVGVYVERALKRVLAGGEAA